MNVFSKHVTINPELFIKDPDSSDLGRKIISGSIIMIHELGFESFTFKKLGKKIGSPESTIYRYFESKHTLLVYLTSWYWCWISYKMAFATANITDKKKKLKLALKTVIEPVTMDNTFSHIDEVLLNKIIVSESMKTFHTKDVDAENKKGYFKEYKQVVQNISDLVLAINSKYIFSHMLISTVIEGVHQQRYFAKHLPSLTDIKKGEDLISKFYEELVFKAIS